MKSLRYALLTTVIVIFLLLFGRCILELSSTLGLSQILAQHFWVFALWRYTLYIVMLLLWPYFIKFLGKRQKWDPEIIQYLSNQQVKILGFLVLIEALFAYNLLGRFLALL